MVIGNGALANCLRLVSSRSGFEPARRRDALRGRALREGDLEVEPAAASPRQEDGRGDYAGKGVAVMGALC
eukprot:scaffold1102_cov256-Pinguiococcus_pyrenoidosus.AAC.3